jgi:hypothetical protein
LICHEKNACCELWSCLQQIFASSHGHFHDHHDISYQKNRINQFDPLVVSPRLFKRLLFKFPNSSIKD